MKWTWQPLYDLLSHSVRHDAGEKTRSSLDPVSRAYKPGLGKAKRPEAKFRISLVRY